MMAVGVPLRKSRSSLASSLKLNLSLSLPVSVSLPISSPPIQLSTHHNAQEVHLYSTRIAFRPTNGTDSIYSGLARSLRASTFRQPTTCRRALQPIKKNFGPAFSARFASSGLVQNGKIHQVIGAVVDGTHKILPWPFELRHWLGFQMAMTDSLLQ